MTLIDLLEQLAADTWERVRDGHELGVRLGETGLSDLLLLEIKRANLPGLRVFKTPQDQESIPGTDWEWWIGSNRTGWIRYAVQAKKLYLASRSYSTLAHPVGGVQQVDILEAYATANRALPIYCLYNYADWVDLGQCWQCNLPRQDSQLGCTISPSHVIRNAITTRGARRFEAVHAHPQSIPWRCLLRCPLLQSLYQPKSSQGLQVAKWMFGQPVHIYDVLPPDLSQSDKRGAMPDFSRDFYRGDAESFPKRILVFDLSAAEEVVSG